MSNSDNKKHKEKIVDKETIPDPMYDQLDAIERALNSIYPPIIRCLLASCKDFFECWDVGAKWKGDIFGCKSPSKLKETHPPRNEYISYAKASRVIRLTRDDIDAIIEAVRSFSKYLPMYKTSLEHLIKKLDDFEEIYGIKE